MNKPSLRSWWGGLTLRVKMAVAAVVPVLVLGVVVPVLYATQQDASTVTTAVERTYRLRGDLASVLQDLVDAETGMRGYLLTNDRRFLQPYRDGLERLPGDLGAVRRRLEGTPSMREVQQLEALVHERLDVLERVHAFANDTPAGTIPLGLLAEGRRVMEDVRTTLGTLDGAQADELVIQRVQLERSQRVAFVLSVILVPFTLLVTMAGVILYASRLVKRVKRIEENARRMEQGEPLLESPGGDDELAKLGRVLARAAATIAEQDAELRELALVDPLTGLHNRRALLEIAEHELQVAIRRGSVIALLFLDVDGLKRVNDELGHAEGDRMLCEMAGILREALRGADVVARVGGDEFCVLLSRDTAMDGLVMLQRLDLKTAERNARGDLPFVLAFSTGIALFDPARPVSVDELIREADASMYEQKRAKRAGPVVRDPDAPVTS